MESFVTTIVTDVTTTTVAFLTSAISGFWGTILSVLFVSGMIALFWRMGKRFFGK